MSETFYMDAEIRPNRSLSTRGFWVLISLVTAINTVTAIVFVRLGATWVPAFLGLDVLAVVVAFAASFRSGRWVEHVRVSAREVTVTLVGPGESRLVWESPTAFTRVDADRDEENRVTACRLALSGRTASVAAALSPGERTDFVRALETAIWRARRER